MSSTVSHLECSRCQRKSSNGVWTGLCDVCSAPLFVRYHLDAIKRMVTKTDLLDRPPDQWRYLEALPLSEESEIVTLGEGFTPLLHLRNAGRIHELRHVYVKDEACNPTASFKARGLSVAVSMARKLGAETVAVPSAGNAGGALAAYAARAGLKAHVFVPEDTPLSNTMEAELTGAQVHLVPGSIADAARELNSQRSEDWFDLSTLKEPYRLEGKKTMGYELAEQFHWKLPDVIVYPTGGGTGLIGMWKAFQEMEELGWIDQLRPKMVAVQSTGCAPIVEAFEKGLESAAEWPHPETFATGLCVPRALGAFLILRVIKESRGRAIAVSDSDTYQAILELGRREGIFFSPEGAACWAALKKLQREGWINSEARVVLFNTAAGTKYADHIRRFQERLNSRKSPGN